MKTIFTFLFTTFLLNSFAQVNVDPHGTGVSTVPDSMKVFTFAEVAPEFPGGEKSFQAFLDKNIQYPKLEKDLHRQGTVYVSFIIERNGSASDIKVIKEVPGAPGLSAEAIRVVSMMPKWTPGKMHGKPVRTLVTQPVKFVLKIVPDCGTLVSNSNPISETFTGRLPVYIGGDSALQAYAKKNIAAHSKRYADLSDKTVRISFVVNESGKVEEVFVKEHNGVPHKTALIAAELFCSMPLWTPGGTRQIKDPKHTNQNIRMVADVYFGKYENKTILFPPKITLMPMLTDGGAPAKVQPPANKIVQPTFVGGDSALAVFIQQNLVYPQKAINAKQEGTVVVSFVVGQDGSVTYVSVIEEIPGAPELSEEAIRLVSSMPKWNPGSIKGVTSQMIVKLPVKFEIKKQGR